MPVHQYAYFVLASDSTPATEITAALDIEPDRTDVRGSRRTEPRPSPPVHRWRVECREPGLAVDEQIACVLRRLRPHTDAIAALTNAPDAEISATLQVVRYFDDGESRFTEARWVPTGDFGWHLGRDILDFLQATRAVLDVDEYGTDS